MFENALSAEAVQEALEILQHEFPLALWETVYVTLLSTAFAIVLGLPLGILLVAGEPQGVLPLPKWLMRALNVLINLLRSVPFLILMILLIPLTRACGHTGGHCGLHRPPGGSRLPLCGPPGREQPARA